MASIRNNLMIVMELIKAGADVNLARHAGYTPLLMAVQWGHEGCAAVLIQAGADIHRRTNMGTTPIKFAIDNEHENIAKLLRQLGARDD
jgi:ankyrin repeat protein